MVIKNTGLNSRNDYWVFMINQIAGSAVQLRIDGGLDVDQELV